MLKITPHIVLLLSPLVALSSAYAYVDPGTGSLLLQLILAGIAGAGLVLKLFWRRIIGIFRKSEQNTDSEQG